MYHESNVIKNFAILGSLAHGRQTLDGIVKQTSLRPQQVSMFLAKLHEKGYIAQVGEQYELRGQVPGLREAIALANEFMTVKTESFYEIARDTANIILNKSWKDVELCDVLLYGSTLTSTNPKDIDILLLHNGGRLAQFTSPRYCEEGQVPIYDVPVGTGKTSRIPSWNIFASLGYVGHAGMRDDSESTKRAVRYIGERIKELNAGTVSQERIDSLASLFKVSTDDVAAYTDMYGIDNVFDVHVLPTPVVNGDSEHMNSARRRMMSACKDKTFWHRVLSQSKIYDADAHDFIIPLEEKYPGALKLWETP